MTRGRNLAAFNFGAGAPSEPQYQCSICGFSGDNRRNFRRSPDDPDQKVCDTGHYEKDGELRRQRNPYAKWSG